MKKMMAKKKGNKFVDKADALKVEEEKGPKCCVCHEGYKKRPTDILGCYVYSKKVAVNELVGANFQNIRQTTGFTTVTQFNPIHLICHQEAMRADANMRPPKREWEGAQIRN